ncbi:MAG TPA: lamin tail domain-containing protein, partial [Acholeplasmataceae bacterium]|nr:lamin tail domain-containing protein [Acholeplasmataceae bacterium]
SQVGNINTEAKTFTLKITANHAIKVEWYPSISEVREQTSGSVEFLGIITRVSGDFVAVADNTGAITIFKGTKPANLAVGDKVKVTGTRSAYKGLEQITSGTVTILTIDNESPVFNITTLEGINARQSPHINVSGLTPDSLSGQNLTVSLNGQTILIRANSSSGAVFEAVQSAYAAKSINLTGVFVDWYNTNETAQFLIENVEQITTVEYTDAEKVALMITTLEAANYNGEVYDMGTTVPFIMTDTRYGTTIEWVYEPTDAVTAQNKWKDVSENTPVKATATVSLGSISDTHIVNVIINYIDSSTDITSSDITIKSTGRHNPGISDGAIPAERISVIGTPTGLENVLTISFSKNDSVNTIFNNSSNEIRLYAGSGNGGELIFGIPEQYQFTSIKIITATNGGYKLNNAGDTITGTDVTTPINGTTISLKNVSTAQVQIKEITVSIEKVSGEINYAAIDIAQIDLGELTLDRSKTLTLPSEGSIHSSDIGWSSTNETYIDSTTGVVTIQDTTQSVTLTATVTSGSFTETKDFKFSLIGKKVTLGNSLAKLPTYGPQIATNLELSESIDGFTITWWSSNDTALNPSTGAITQTAEAQEVTLTATISLEGTNDTRTYNLEILPLGGEIEGTLIIYEVYGGGGNKNATYTHDYIILYNGSNAAIDLTGYSIQYGSSTTTSPFGNRTNLSGTIPSKGYFKIQAASGGSTGSALPFTPDLISDINLSGTAGKLALVNGTEAITNSTDPSVVDFVGFGSKANDYEGAAPAPAPSNSTSIKRGSFVDTNNNETDFIAGVINLNYLNP